MDGGWDHLLVPENPAFASNVPVIKCAFHHCGYIVGNNRGLHVRCSSLASRSPVLEPLYRAWPVRQDWTRTYQHMRAVYRIVCVRVEAAFPQLSYALLASTHT
eukprot:gene11754-biopygen19905